MILLAEAWLRNAGAGRDPLDFTFLNADRLANDLGLASTEAVRQSINRTRGVLRRKFASAGRDGEHGAGIIENLPWQGYRLAPDKVTVRVKKPEERSYSNTSKPSSS